MDDQFLLSSSVRSDKTSLATLMEQCLSLLPWLLTLWVLSSPKEHCTVDELDLHLGHHDIKLQADQTKLHNMVLLHERRLRWMHSNSPAPTSAIAFVAQPWPEGCWASEAKGRHLGLDGWCRTGQKGDADCVGRDCARWAPSHPMLYTSLPSGDGHGSSSHRGSWMGAH
ncbi:hypothetical protein Dimus_016157 [Dionaea muscipula]